MFAAYGCVLDFACHCVRVDDVLEGLITLRCVTGSYVFDLPVSSILGVVDLYILDANVFFTRRLRNIIASHVGTCLNVTTRLVEGSAPLGYGSIYL